MLTSSTAAFFCGALARYPSERAMNSLKLHPKSWAECQFWQLFNGCAVISEGNDVASAALP